MAIGPGEPEELTVQADTAWGKLRYLTPSVELSETPCVWDRQAVPLGTRPPAWPDWVARRLRIALTCTEPSSATAGPRSQRLEEPQEVTVRVLHHELTVAFFGVVPPIPLVFERQHDRGA